MNDRLLMGECSSDAEWPEVGPEPVKPRRISIVLWLARAPNEAFLDLITPSSAARSIDMRWTVGTTPPHDFGVFMPLSGTSPPEIFWRSRNAECLEAQRKLGRRVS